MKNGFIYGLRCPLSGEIKYVGQTINLDKRLRQHKNDKRFNTHKVNCIKKLNRLGILEELKIEILEECNKEYLNEKEKFWIEKLKNDGCKLVNLTDGGDGNAGYICSDETREKLRILSTGRKHSDEAKMKISKQKIGIKLSDNHKEQIRIGLKKAYNENRKSAIISDEQKLKISNGLKKYFTENPRRKKEKIKKNYYIKKGKPNMSGDKNPFYGKKHSDETKKKMKEIKKRYVYRKG